MSIENNIQNATAQEADVAVSVKASVTDTPKSVAIIIPCRNEEEYIGRCLDSLLANDYDKRFLQIVVVDGLSTDHTRKIIEKYCKKYDFIRILDNPEGIKPVALNLGIKATQSDIIMRIDAHTVYAPNYISKLVEGLYKYKADNIGGVRETDLGNTLCSKAVGIIISHPFGNGNAYWRTGCNEIRQVDTVFCGCYRRDVFNQIGYFNERLIRTQDREFNVRLTQNGGTIILDPSVRCTYYPRTKLIDYFKWNFAGAYWLNYVRRFTRVKMISRRNIIPLVFVVWHFGLLFIPFLSSWLTLFITLPVLGYWALAIFFSGSIAREHKSVALAPVMLFLFSLTHYGYGLGSVIGLTRSYVLKRDIPV